ncbi:hypothetical protein [Staphylococcus hyicus]|uniref:hypothetical protein n=1 Tax=Staphylococcus hyicus TaxID=1284 RepID=UPI0036D27E33|nr:hypothetical protein [Staphylococcus aureus]HDE6765626.1 hypothetical protein [Staphylococcus aureus]
MSQDKEMFIEWLLLMDPVLKKEALMKCSIEELQHKFNLCRLQQIDDEQEALK